MNRLMFLVFIVFLGTSCSAKKNDASMEEIKPYSFDYHQYERLKKNNSIPLEYLEIYLIAGRVIKQTIEPEFRANYICSIKETSSEFIIACDIPSILNTSDSPGLGSDSSEISFAVNKSSKKVNIFPILE